MEISSYIDFLNHDLKQQINFLNQVNLPHGLILRNINGESFLNQLTQNYHSLPALAAINLGHHLFSFNANEGAIVNLINSLLLNTPRLIINIDLNQPLKALDEYLTNVHKLFPTAILYLNPQANFNSVIIKELLRKTKIKQVYLYFGLKELFNQNISYLFAYRLLFPYIKMISFTDYDQKDNPCLLGYGRFELLSFFKLLLENHYQGMIILDSDVFDIVKFYDKSYRKIKDTLKRKKYHSAWRVIKSTVSHNGNLTVQDTFKNQITVLKKVFTI